MELLLKSLLLPVINLLIISTGAVLAIDQPCDSNIYCYGHLLHTVQIARPFRDSKTFVDRPLKYQPETILANFDFFMKSHQQYPSKEDVRNFVEANFEQDGHEFAPWYPVDWKEYPRFLNRIANPKLNKWAKQLHDFWRELGREIKKDVGEKQAQNSMIYVSKPVIVPGGRFKEFYYWDSYWIQEGLILSEMFETVKGMLENFIQMVSLLGFVPNGGRVYYQRSQPPLLIPMVKNYFDATHDIDFIKLHFPTLENEFKFWIMNRSINIKVGDSNYTLVRYNSEKGAPRPESYGEDYKLAFGLPEKEKEELYFNLHSGAESGWDFSSRWFEVPEGSNIKANLSHTKTRNVIPVELNAFMYYNAKLLSEFATVAGVVGKAEYYDNIANHFKEAINTLLWDEEAGSWFDYDIVKNTLRKDFYPSNIAPLWAGAEEKPSTVKRVINYLRTVGALDYPGGIPTSLKQTGEQWDFPNGWAPLQSFVVNALVRSNDEEANALAFEIAERWVLTNYVAFYQATPNAMFEKYDVSVVGLPGGGGEYDTVVGFGWSNAVVLDFMNRYGDRLVVHDEDVHIGSLGHSGVTHQLSPFASTTLLLAIVCLLVGGALGLKKLRKHLTSSHQHHHQIRGDKSPYSTVTTDYNTIQPPTIIQSHSAAKLVSDDGNAVIGRDLLS